MSNIKNNSESTFKIWKLPIKISEVSLENGIWDDSIGNKPEEKRNWGLVISADGFQSCRTFPLVQNLPFGLFQQEMDVLTCEEW